MLLAEATAARQQAAQAPSWYEIGQRDWNILLPFFGYMVGVFVIAIISHRYLKRGEFETEYYVGSRSFGAWVLAFSWVATLASGGSFLGYPSLVYSYGWSMAIWVSGSTVTAIVGLGIVGKRINRLARQTGALTLVDLLRDRFNSQVIGVVYAVLIVIVTTVYLIAQFVAGARIIESVLETSYLMGLILFAVSVVWYTTYGGFRAVAWTDTLQGIVMIVGVVLLVPLALFKVGGLENATRAQMTRPDPMAELRGEPTEKHAYLYGPGPTRITRDADAPETSAPEPSPASPSDPWIPAGIGMSLFLVRSLGSVVMPTTVPRMLAFRDTLALKRALMLLAPYFLLMYGSSLITMNCAYALDLGLGPYESDRAVPELAKIIAPPLLAGLLIAAPFAAVMSTVDSALLVISAAVVRDFVQKTLRLGLNTRATKQLSYLVTAGAGGLVFMLALVIEPDFLQPLVIHYVGSSAAALFWPSLATLYWKRATAAGVTAGLVGGGAAYIVAALTEPLADFFPMHPFVYGFTASAALTGIVSLRGKAQVGPRLAIYFGKENA